MRAGIALCALGFLLAVTACSREETGGTASERAHYVEIELATLREMAQRSEHSGHIEARRRVRIHSQEEGLILDLPWFEGDSVESGAVLLRLDDSVLAARLDQAVASRRQAAVDLERIRNLATRGLLSQDERARAETALELAEAEERVLRTRSGYMTIRAPFAGVVSRRMVEPGDAVSSNTHLLSLVDPTSLVIEITVSELLLPELAPGHPVTVRIDALGRQPSQGVISRIHPEIDARTGRGTVEVSLDPVPQGARPGQFARVSVESVNQPRLTIPFAALQRDHDSEFVYLVEEGRATRRVVASGVRIDDRVEIVDGLEAGAPVVVRGLLGLRVGGAVSVVERDR